jgi:hypothetical protein
MNNRNVELKLESSSLYTFRVVLTFDKSAMASAKDTNCDFENKIKWIVSFFYSIQIPIKNTTIYYYKLNLLFWSALFLFTFLSTSIKIYICLS